MTKRLLLVRHADTRAAERLEKDFDRTLTAAGKNQSKALGEFLLTNEIQPECIVSSTAVRAWETSQIIAGELGLENERLVGKREIYSADVSVFLLIVNQLENDLKTVFLIGHNPTISYFARYLLGNSSLPGFSTSQCLFISFEWRTGRKFRVGWVSLIT